MMRLKAVYNYLGTATLRHDNGACLVRSDQVAVSPDTDRRRPARFSKVEAPVEGTLRRNAGNPLSF
jgi:hypothetical protein